MARYQIRRGEDGWFTPYRRLFGVWWDLSFWCQGDGFVAYFSTEGAAREWLTRKPSRPVVVDEFSV